MSEMSRLITEVNANWDQIMANMNDPNKAREFLEEAEQVRIKIRLDPEADWRDVDNESVCEVAKQLANLLRRKYFLT